MWQSVITVGIVVMGAEMRYFLQFFYFLQNVSCVFSGDCEDVVRKHLKRVVLGAVDVKTKDLR